LLAPMRNVDRIALWPTTFCYCIMRMVVCMEDIAVRVLRHGADDMIEICDKRIALLERTRGPSSVDVPVKVNAVVVQANLSAMVRRHTNMLQFEVTERAFAY